jgi:hypothetical protein
LLVANHHKHVHHKHDEPKSKLREYAEPIILITIFVYAAQWAFRFPKNLPVYLAAGILFGGAAVFLWIQNPRKDR